MIKYYKDFSLSLTEINNKPTLSVYSLEKCNLNCFECLNKPILQNKENYKTIEDIINYIDNNDNLFEYIVFSGNEFLTASLEDLGNDLLKIRQITDKHIVIYTNGTFPSKMKRIYATSLVDGFHTDIKLPWHLITMKDKELMLMTVGKFLFDYEIEDIKKSIDFTVKCDQGLNQLRTVRYPFLPEDTYTEIQLWIKDLNQKYGRRTPYFVNDFFNKLS
jgi:pyruvate-formate lyase-activating enzyme